MARKGQHRRGARKLEGIVSEGFGRAILSRTFVRCSNSDVQEKTLVDINKLVSSVLALVVIDLQKQDRTSDGIRRSIPRCSAIKFSYSG